ncbi:MAG: ATP-binding protein [Cyclobacteriaceae bacterium]|nr:ATP-binding protein [Cyclobacteriaceae bacterium]
MKYFYKIPCKKDHLKDLRSFVWKALVNHGLTEIDISTLVLAIDEICANLIIHSDCRDPNEFIKININIIKNEGIEFSIHDHGSGFDISKYDAPTLDELIKTKRKGGIGLILVRKIMDKIELVNESGQNVCKLYKKANVY